MNNESTMSLDLYDTNFERIIPVDIWKSLIWTDRYQKAGDFELYISPSSNLFNYIERDCYLYNHNSEHMMIVEDITTETDEENGNTVVITGRSLESILDRRIVYKPLWFAGPIDEAIKLILNKNIISPVTGNYIYAITTDTEINTSKTYYTRSGSEGNYVYTKVSSPVISELSNYYEQSDEIDEKRIIRNVIYVETNDARIKKIGVDIQLVGESVLDTITDLCSTYNIGFKIIFNWTTKNFEFSLYKGTDRSQNNPSNETPVEFSAKNENLFSSKYIETNSGYKNMAMIGGEGDGDKKKYAYLYENDYSGLNRREVYVDGSSISQELDNHKLSDSEYKRQLKEEGKKKLKETEIQTAFEGEIDSSSHAMFFFRKDYSVGDIIFLKNEYNKSSDVLITESVESWDESGYKLTPTFESINEDAKISSITLVNVQETYNYNLTTDTEIDTTKTYYTRSGSSGSYTYTKVTSPTASSLSSYYERAFEGSFTINGLSSKVDIDWGDGSKEYEKETSAVHTYSKEGSYKVKITRSDRYDMDFCPVFTENTKLQKIELPNFITTIPEKAFQKCTSLAEISIPSSVTSIVGDYAFQGCTALYSIVLPNGLTSLGKYFFDGCTNLASANFPYSCEKVPSYFFNGCVCLRNIDFPGNTLAGKGVTEIEEYAMNGCKRLSSITFGSRVNKINGTCTAGLKRSCSIECLNEYAPTLTANFSTGGSETVGTKTFTGEISGITVPTSPNWDDTILKRYNTATNWKNYSSKISEKDNKEE